MKQFTDMLNWTSNMIYPDSKRPFFFYKDSKKPIWNTDFAVELIKTPLT